MDTKTAFDGSQESFNALLKSGDAGATWAAVENHIVQQVSAVQKERDDAVSAAQKERDDIASQLDALDPDRKLNALAVQKQALLDQAKALDAEMAKLK